MKSIKNYIDSIIIKYLNESYEKVVRGGKVYRKLICKPGYKVEDGKCVKMDSEEKRNRLKAAKKSAKKRKSKMASIIKKRNKSIKKRTW